MRRAYELNDPNSFNELLEHYLDIHVDMIKMLMFGILGLIGGAVRVCGHTGKWPWRKVISSLAMSTFAGSLTGAIVHQHIADPMYLGAVCSLGGYIGQGSLFIIATVIEKRAGIKVDIPREDEND